MCAFTRGHYCEHVFERVTRRSSDSISFEMRRVRFELASSSTAPHIAACVIMVYSESANWLQMTRFLVSFADGAMEEEQDDTVSRRLRLCVCVHVRVFKCSRCYKINNLLAIHRHRHRFAQVDLKHVFFPHIACVRREGISRIISS